MTSSVDPDKIYLVWVCIVCVRVEFNSVIGKSVFLNPHRAHYFYRCLYYYALDKELDR